MILLKNIVKDYGQGSEVFHALNGVSLSFGEKGFVAILGHSGCGKTTLLNILGGLDRPTSGNMIVDGKDTSSFSTNDFDSYRNFKIGFIFQEYNLLPEILLCMQTGKRITDEDRMKFDTNEFYIKSPEEMIDYFEAVPEAIENTCKIADKCNFEFEFGVTKLPNYDVPKEFKTHEEYLRKLCNDGVKERYGENPSKEILDRIEYEFSVISKMGYIDYYLIVWDFIHYAKTHEIPVGPRAWFWSRINYCIYYRYY